MKKYLAVGFLIFFNFSCEQNKIFSRKKQTAYKTDKNTINSVYIFEEINKILKNDCVSCHQVGIATGTEFFATNTPSRSEVVVHKSEFPERLNAVDAEKVMPPRNLRYKHDEASGRLLIQYLKEFL